MLCHIFLKQDRDIGYLVGGVSSSTGKSACLGSDNVFIVEADEYDSAFFDKRSKFIHYKTNTLIINNIEFDHADIFRDLDDIKKQFHHLLSGQCRAARLEFFIADQDVCAAGIQINAHHVPRLNKCKSATRGRLWRGVQDRGGT